MLINKLVKYEDAYPIYINEEGESLFYFFDYDVRNHAINMEFQHFHTFFEFCILFSPNAVHLIEGKKYNIECFDIVGIAPNVLHRTYYPEGDPCKRLIIRFNMPYDTPFSMPKLNDVFTIFNQEIPIFRFNPEINKEIFAPINDIFELGKSDSSIKDLEIHIKFIEFLMLLYKHRNDNIYASESPDSNIESKIFQITSYIHTHYQEDLSLEQIAQQFYISNYYLSHQFKNITGFTLTDYIHMTRIRNVQSLLITTKDPITEIAENCGFSSFSQFNRVFRKILGVSPSEYRKSGKR